MAPDTPRIATARAISVEDSAAPGSKGTPLIHAKQARRWGKLTAEFWPAVRV